MAAIRTYDVGPAVLEEYPDGLVVTTFKADGSVCRFAPPTADTGQVDPEFVAAALEMGYSDTSRYAVEHEIAHHLVAAGRGLEHSAIVWDAAHNLEMSLDEPERAAEEHLVNRLQRYMNLGAADPYACLEEELGEKLQERARTLLAVARPWLQLSAQES